MKVLHVESGMHLYGGARQVVYIIEGLQKNAVENILVCPVDSAIAEAAKSFAAIQAVKMGGDIDLSFIFRLNKIIKQEKPDLVHLHSRRGADVLGGIAARLAAVPCVLSRRVDNPEPVRLAQWKYKLYDRVITISEGIRAVLLSQGIPAEKVICVHSSVDAEPYQHPCEEKAFHQLFDLPENAIVVAMIAQFIPRKGHQYLLDALPDVLADFPNLQVLLFGKGPLIQQIQADIDNRNLTQHIKLAGFRDDLERWLCCMDLVVHPADMEGLGVSLLQAAAAGVPVIGSRAGGIPEIVHHAENGLLIEPGDTSALAEAMKKLLADTKLRQQMGQRGKEIVKQNYSPAVMVTGNLDVYRQVLSGH